MMNRCGRISELIRPILHVDAGRCLGCRQCLPSCPRGAIIVVKDAARLIDDALCAGQGACIGHCSADALSIRRRAASRHEGNGACRPE